MRTYESLSHCNITYIKISNFADFSVKNARLGRKKGVMNKNGACRCWRDARKRQALCDPSNAENISVGSVH